MASQTQRTPSLGLCSSFNKTKVFRSCHQADNMLIKLHDFYEEKEFLDVVLITGIDDVRLKVHRVVIASSSDYFRAMFRSNLKEAKADEIELKEIDGKTLKLIVDFMYTSSIRLCCETVESVLIAANFLQMNTLVSGCCKFIAEQLEASNCLGILLFAEQHSLFQLSKKSYEFAYVHFEQICPMEEFLHLNDDQLSKFISNDTRFMRSEENMFLSLVAWYEHDKVKREKLFNDLLRLHIDFRRLTPQFLSENRHSVRLTESHELICNWIQWHLSPKSRLILSEVIPTATRKKNHLVVINKDFKVQTFNPEFKKWFSEEWPLPSSRGPYSVAATKNRLAVAGIDGCIKCLDLKTMKWTTLPPIRSTSPVPMIAFDEILLVLGSIEGKGFYRKTSVHIYNFLTLEWKNAKSVTNNEKYALGVYEGQVYAGSKCPFLYCYDNIADNWISFPLRSNDMECCGIAEIGKYLYAVVKQENQSHMIDRYDSLTESWTEITSLTLNCIGIKCTAWNERLIICEQYEDSTKAVREYNPETEEWTCLGPLPGDDAVETLNLFSIENK